MLHHHLYGSARSARSTSRPPRSEFAHPSVQRLRAVDGGGCLGRGDGADVVFGGEACQGGCRAGDLSRQYDPQGVRRRCPQIEAAVAPHRRRGGQGSRPSPLQEARDHRHDLYDGGARLPSKNWTPSVSNTRFPSQKTGSSSTRSYSTNWWRTGSPKKRASTSRG
jgi:hypothetical protein